ncbi:MAG: SusD/RagB family nutrient-binding outer membrane lipoprotein [Tannerellaceae bacterium]|nr:SusD/RagB family nutrient-binding outer membrane lipoprotein [Tannerellaceae bacterium]
MKISNLIILLIVAILLGGCDKFDDINTNPDTPTTGTASLLATGLIRSVVWKGTYKDFVYDMLIDKHIAWYEGNMNEQYNRFGKKEFTNLPTLVDCQDLINVASGSEKDGYTGLALFVKAHILYYTSLDLGDIPCSEAGRGEEGILKPKYDTQKEVMLTVLDYLDEAYNCFTRANDISAGQVIEGDPILNGSRDKWKKAVTAFQLKVLINLSKKADDPDLKLATRFADAVNNKSLMTSNSDNLQVVFSDKSGMTYPLNIGASNQAKYAMMSSFLFDMLKKYDDYRIFYYAEPALSKIAAGVAEDDYEAYQGVDPSAPFDDILETQGRGDCSILNERYTELDFKQGEPLIRLGYGEQQMILAEACLRNWIGGDAEDYYKKGIEANLNFVKDVTPDNYTHNRTMTSGYIAGYLANPAIGFSGNFEEDLERIMEQKYMASFFQYPYECYYDYRRTGYPVLPINPNTNQNTISDRIPVRYMYHDSEYSYNRENLEEALKRQFNGNDEVNELMWILK